MFPTANWPVAQEAAKQVLKTIVDMHHMVPIPAYDMQGHLIAFFQYCSCLAGAVVELHFELSHLSIGGKETEPSFDTYIADVAQIWVLIPPKPWVVTLMKCKVLY